jgi:hypothetical protein
MTSVSAIATYSGSAATTVLGEKPWVRLEQKMPPATGNTGSLLDLYLAWSLAAAGFSALMYRPAGCPVEFDGQIIRFFLGFYAWPSHPDLKYKLTASIGELGIPVRVIPIREASYFVENTDAILLKYYMLSVAAHWETPTYNAYGETIRAPRIHPAGAQANFDTPVFGGLRVQGIAVGDYWVVTVEVDKSTDRIEDVNITITASWDMPDGTTESDTIALGTEQNRLTIPQCVLDALAMCPGDESYKYYLEWCKKVTSTIVYVNACTGEVIETREGKDQKKFCSKFGFNTDPGPWLLSLTRPR